MGQQQQAASGVAVNPPFVSMASSTTPTLLPLLLALLLSTTFPPSSAYPPMTLTIVNNCHFPIWPAIQPNAGHILLQNGGFYLPPLSHRSFPAPTTHWSGRIWGRTGCTTTPHAAHLTCLTGDCGNRLECSGLGGAPPATLAQIQLHHAGARDLTSYGVSLVDGYNVPMTVTPHEGQGVCPVVGCRADLLPTCPGPMQVRAHAGGAGGHVVGCKSGCEAFGTDELCCRGRFNSAGVCKPSEYSEFFKKACPATFTYAHDSPSLTHDCAAPKELKVIFCH